MEISFKIIFSGFEIIGRRKFQNYLFRYWKKVWKLTFSVSKFGRQYQIMIFSKFYFSYFLKILNYIRNHWKKVWDYNIWSSKTMYICLESVKKVLDYNIWCSKIMYICLESVYTTNINIFDNSIFINIKHICILEITTKSLLIWWQAFLTLTQTSFFCISSCNTLKCYIMLTRSVTLC